MVRAIGTATWTAPVIAALVAMLAWRSRAAQAEAVARACHELRGPLTAARLGLELGARTGELSQARLQAIDLELRQAALALDDLAAIRGSTNARVAAEQVDVAELLASSVEAWRASAARRGVDLEMRWYGPPARVWGDQVRLAQATCNLIANAIEHGGGEVEVRGRRDEDSVRIEVSDSGPGLPAPVALLVRQPHHPGDQRGRGLAIANGIVAAHGGRLGAVPSRRGARLVLELPAAQPAATAGEDGG